MNKRLLVVFVGMAIGTLLILIWLTLSTLLPAAFAQGGNQTCPLTKDQAGAAANAFQAMDVVFTSPRCANCHGAYGDLSTNPQTKHPGGYIPLDNFGKPKDPAKQCVNCHDLGGSKWQIAPEHMFFTGKNDVSLCQQMKRMSTGIALLQHIDNDKLIELGFQGKKGQSDLPANPPPVSKDGFLDLTEKWVGAVYLSSNKNDWTKTFPGGNESSCGCDANTFKQEAPPPGDQMNQVVSVLTGLLTPPCSSTQTQGCAKVTNNGGLVNASDNRTVNQATKRTSISVLVSLTEEGALSGFQEKAKFYSDPANNLFHGTLWRSEKFAAGSGSTEDAVLQVSLSPNDSRQGDAVGYMVCGNLDLDLSMTVFHPSAIGVEGEQAVVNTQRELKTLMQKLKQALQGAGVCGAGASPLPTAPSLPASPPVLATIGKSHDGFIEVRVYSPSPYPNNPPIETFAGEGTELHFGDSICFKGSGTLDLKWSDGSTVSVSGSGGPALGDHCLDIAPQRPNEKSGPGIIRQILSVPGDVIRYVVSSPDHPSNVMMEDDNVNIQIKQTKFLLAEDASQAASIVCAEEGVVHITPKNSSLAPVDVAAGYQVRITANEMSPVTPGCTLPVDTVIPQPNPNVSGMTLQAGTRYVVAGDSVLVPFWLVKAENLANLNFQIVYDPKVLQPSGNIVKGNLLDNALFKANANQTGAVLVGMAQTSPLNGTGTVLNLPFHAVGKPGDSSPLLLTVTTINDPNGAELEIDRISGRITVVNEDGTLPPVGGNTGGGSSGGGGAGGGSGSGGSGPVGIQKGDCDGSGGLPNELDALCALEMSVGIRAPRLFVDTDGSGVVTSRDASIILQRAVGQ